MEEHINSLVEELKKKNKYVYSELERPLFIACF